MQVNVERTFSGDLLTISGDFPSDFGHRKTNQDDYTICLISHEYPSAEI